MPTSGDWTVAWACCNPKAIRFRFPTRKSEEHEKWGRLTMASRFLLQSKLGAHHKLIAFTRQSGNGRVWASHNPYRPKEHSTYPSTQPTFCLTEIQEDQQHRLSQLVNDRRQGAHDRSLQAGFFSNTCRGVPPHRQHLQIIGHTCLKMQGRVGMDRALLSKAGIARP